MIRPGAPTPPEPSWQLQFSPRERRRECCVSCVRANGAARNPARRSIERFSSKPLLERKRKTWRAAHRIGARVSSLSPEQLCAMIDEQAPLWSAAALRVAEEHAARLVEQPEWVLSEVLLSPDLAPQILAQLPTKEHAAKGTCCAWRRGWKETLRKRERPRLVVIGGRDNDGEFLNSLEPPTVHCAGSRTPLWL